MRLVVETEDNQEKALLVRKDTTPFLDALIERIKSYDIHISQTTEIPYSFNDIDYMFLMQDTYTEGELKQIFESATRTLIITSQKKIFNEFSELIEQNVLNHVKVVLVHDDEVHEDVIERVLWFMLRSSREHSLNVSSHLPPPRQKTSRIPQLTFKLTKKRLVIAGIFIIFAIHTMFLLPLIGTTYYIYDSGIAARDQRFEAAEKSLETGKALFTVTEATYALARPGLQFLFLSVIPENIINTQSDALSFIESTISATRNTRAIVSLLLNTSKNPAQVDEVRSRIETLEKEVATLEKTSLNMYDRLDYNITAVQEIRSEFETLSGYLNTGSRLVSHLDTLLADGTEKDYILFFYNNMEIRPGGGFIGSFAHVTFNNYTLQSFEVYDVYDADGQLRTHVRPPEPIREYLDQPHWFLRDSNFSPDFEQNVQNAEFFLDKELQLRDFDGAVALTTTALTYMLEAFGDVYVSDFDETINAENFYLLTQSRAEDEFFEGSIQKKSFLSTVGRTLMLKMEDADPARLGLAIKRALDEKHIVILTEEPSVQADIDVLGWSGKVLNPQCIVNSPHCIINHILPIDANLGVNKANYYVNKLMKLKTVFEPNGEANNELSISYTNNSTPEIYPGGRYKNYFQVYIPHDASVQAIDIDGIPVRDFEISTTGLFKVVGLLMEVQPQETSVVTIKYQLTDAMQSGENAYQIVFQKQIGSYNNDFSFEVHFPEGVLVTDKNFKSVAKNNSVLYNSTLATNKVFVVEFVNSGGSAGDL